MKAKLIDIVKNQIDTTFDNYKNNKITSDEAKDKILSLATHLKNGQKWIWLLGLCSGFAAGIIFFIILRVIFYFY